MFAIHFCLEAVKANPSLIFFPLKCSFRFFTSVAALWKSKNMDDAEKAYRVRQTMADSRTDGSSGRPKRATRRAHGANKAGTWRTPDGRRTSRRMADKQTRAQHGGEAHTCGLKADTRRTWWTHGNSANAARANASLPKKEPYSKLFGGKLQQATVNLLTLPYRACNSTLYHRKNAPRTSFFVGHCLYCTYPTQFNLIELHFKPKTYPRLPSSNPAPTFLCPSCASAGIRYTPLTWELSFATLRQPSLPFAIVAKGLVCFHNGRGMNYEFQGGVV